MRTLRRGVMDRETYCSTAISIYLVSYYVTAPCDSQPVNA